MEQNPLVSLCIANYNQADYILAALESAFAQTYSPLEIIIGDDCSTDVSPGMIQDAVDNYLRRGGRHQIRYIRNEHNLGLVRNYENLFSMANGELVVTGGGDDIYMPDRVEKIVKAWLDGGRKATVIAHAWREMGVDGQCYGVDGPRDATMPLGAAIAYASWAIRGFPKIEILDSYEDHIYTFRALCHGDYLMLKDALIRYRIGSGVSTSGGVRRRRGSISRRSVKSAEQSRIDIKSCRANLDPSRVKIVESMIDWEFAHYGAEYDLFEGGTFWRRFKGFRGMNKENDWRISPLRKLLVYGPYVIAPRWGDRVLGCYSALKRAFNLSR